MLEQRGQFAGKTKRVAFLKIIERLFREPIAAREEAAADPVINDERPHPVQAFDEALAPRAVTMQQHLRVGMVRQKNVTKRFQFAAQFRVIVDLAVKDDADLAVAGPHRLRASGEIDDRKTAE